MPKLDLDKLLAPSLRQEMEKRDRPWREILMDQIPFLKKRPSQPSKALARIAVNIGRFWEEPEFAFAWQAASDYEGEYGDLDEDEDSPLLFQLDELLDLIPGEQLSDQLRVPESAEERQDLAVAIVQRATEALSEPGEISYDGVPQWVRAAVVEDRLRALAGLPTDLRQRVFFVDPATAKSFIKRHHSALPERNFRGILYDLGLEVGGRLVAVMAVNTPTGKKGIEEAAHVVEVSRVASDASVHGASSALVGKAIELLSGSTRLGTKRPGLLVTYSLLSELGTTYKSLEDMGLRPVAFVPAKKSQAKSSQRGTVAAMANVPKIRWEAGVEAAPADKTLLRLVRPYRKAKEGRRIDKDDLKPLNVERLQDLLQALTGSRLKMEKEELVANTERELRALERKRYAEQHDLLVNTLLGLGASR
jgi:hypothetical protein